MKFVRKILGISKWVTVTSVSHVETKDIRYMEIKENNKTHVVLL